MVPAAASTASVTIAPQPVLTSLTTSTTSLCSGGFETLAVTSTGGAGTGGRGRTPGHLTQGQVCDDDSGYSTDSDDGLLPLVILR